MVEDLVRPHAVTAVMRLAGPQQTTMSVHNGGTDEAYVGVTVGRSVIYLHTLATLNRFGQVWDDAQPYSLQLPAARALQLRRGGASDIAQPSVVVHTAGTPAASFRLAKTAPRQLSITIGDLAFLIYDQRAFRDCARTFLEASQVGREQLTSKDLRMAPVTRGKAVLAGHDADRAASQLRSGAQAQGIRRAAGAVHPAVRAARLWLSQPGAAPQPGRSANQTEPSSTARLRLAKPAPQTTRGYQR